jgi:hypothetical protein
MTEAEYFLVRKDFDARLLDQKRRWLAIEAERLKIKQHLPHALQSVICPPP